MKGFESPPGPKPNGYSPTRGGLNALVEGTQGLACFRLEQGHEYPRHFLVTAHDLGENLFHRAILQRLSLDKSDNGEMMSDELTKNRKRHYLLPTLVGAHRRPGNEILGDERIVVAVLQQGDIIHHSTQLAAENPGSSQRVRRRGAFEHRDKEAERALPFDEKSKSSLRAGNR